MRKSSRNTKLLLGLGILLASILLWINVSTRAKPDKMSVILVGLTNNPSRQSTPVRIEASPGATGLCALFWVTNNTSDQTFWFRTSFAEQKTPSGWQRVPSNSNMPWYGVGGSIWSPNSGCYYAVGWPPGLATNSTWRLRVSYGREPSELGNRINQIIGRQIFRSAKEEGTFPSSEVKLKTKADRSH